jgi:hypothetical protein
MSEFRAKVEDGAKGWRANVTLPYIEAYSAAFDGYQKAIADQKETDRQRAELFIAGASILTGSVLMASVATSSLRTLAGRIGLQVVCSNNMNRTFNALHVISNNKAMMFALGKLADDAKSRIGKEAEDIVTQYMQANSHVISSVTPLVQHVQLERIITNHELCAKRVAENVEASDRPEAEKAAVFADLRRSPIYNPPVRAINPVTLAPKLELCFYMTNILDSDELIDWPGQSNFSGFGGGMASAMGAKSKPIEAMPTSKSYPRPAAPQRHWYGTDPHQTIGITRLGSAVRKRVDEVCAIVRRKPFYGSNSESGSTNDATKPAELTAAARIITELAEQTRPQGPLDQRL